MTTLSGALATESAEPPDLAAVDEELRFENGLSAGGTKCLGLGVRKGFLLPLEPRPTILLNRDRGVGGWKAVKQITSLLLLL